MQMTSLEGCDYTVLDQRSCWSSPDWWFRE